MTDHTQDAVAAIRSDEQFVAHVKHELDGSCRALDGHTLSRLNSIRHAALEKRQTRWQTERKRNLLPLGGLVSAFVLVLAVSLVNSGRVPESETPAANSPVEDIELLSAAESLDLFEDYEFYQWLAENETSI